MSAFVLPAACSAAPLLCPRPAGAKRDASRIPPPRQVLLSTGFSLVFAVAIRSWVPFATVMIRTAAEIARANPALARVSAAATFVQQLWLLVLPL